MGGEHFQKVIVRIDPRLLKYVSSALSPNHRRLETFPRSFPQQEPVASSGLDTTHEPS